MNKTELYQFMLSLNRDNWLDLEDRTSYDKFNEWFETQYKSRICSDVKSKMENN